MGAVLKLVGRGLSKTLATIHEVTAYHWIEDSEKWMPLKASLKQA